MDTLSQIHPSNLVLFLCQFVILFMPLPLQAQTTPRPTFSPTLATYNGNWIRSVWANSSPAWTLANDGRTPITTVCSNGYNSTRIRNLYVGFLDGTTSTDLNALPWNYQCYTLAKHQDCFDRFRIWTDDSSLIGLQFGSALGMWSKVFGTNVSTKVTQYEQARSGGFCIVAIRISTGPAATSLGVFEHIDSLIMTYAIIPPTPYPTTDPTFQPTVDPTADPTADPTDYPTSDPTIDPTADPTTSSPTRNPTFDPTLDPTTDPSQDPTKDPTADPTLQPSVSPTMSPTLASYNGNWLRSVWANSSPAWTLSNGGRIPISTVCSNGYNSTRIRNLHVGWVDGVTSTDLNALPWNYQCFTLSNPHQDCFDRFRIWTDDASLIGLQFGSVDGEWSKVFGTNISTKVTQYEQARSGGFCIVSIRISTGPAGTSLGVFEHIDSLIMTYAIIAPTPDPSASPTAMPTTDPSAEPTQEPTFMPSIVSTTDVLSIDSSLTSVTDARAPTAAPEDENTNSTLNTQSIPGEVSNGVPDKCIILYPVCMLALSLALMKWI